MWKKRNEMQIEIQKGKKNGEQSLFKELIEENIPDLRQELNVQANEAKRTPGYGSEIKPT